MQKPSLGWQSWSPPIPIWPYLPRRDYSPVIELAHPPAPPTTQKPGFTYWCSWYGLGPKLNYNNLIEQARIIKQNSLPIDYFLIDDGWADAPWLTLLTKELHLLDLKVGLWYAPFTRHVHLPIKKTLDRLITTNKLDLLKLDFLYLPYFAKGLIDDSIPHKTLVNLYDYLSTRHSSVLTIACGAPFSPTLGRVDAIRVSKDSTFPPYVPHPLRLLLYHSRLKLLESKLRLIPPHFPSLADPDVRMFSLDNSITDSFWDTIHTPIIGIGDDLTKLNQKQLTKAKTWLQNHSSRS